MSNIKTAEENKYNLLPCPFCGRDELSIGQEPCIDRTISLYTIFHSYGGTQCAVSMLDSSKKRLITRWNNRISQPSLPVDVEEFIKENEVSEYDKDGYPTEQKVIDVDDVRSLISKVIKDKDEEIKKVVEGNRMEAIEFTKNIVDKYYLGRIDGETKNKNFEVIQQLYDQYINQKQIKP